MAHDRPAPYDADRYRWMIPNWFYKITRPKSTNGWFITVLGVVLAIVAAAVALRQAITYWYIALPVLGAAWWLADRWWRTRWTVEQERRGRLAELRLSIEELDAMTWLEFEFAVRDLMRRDGVAAEHVGKPGDFSGDVVGHDPALGETWMVQAKHYGPRSRVGSEDVQKVAGAAQPVYQAGLTLVVTTNTYTKPARTFATLSGMHLIARDELIDWASRGIHLHAVLGITSRPPKSA